MNGQTHNFQPAGQVLRIEGLPSGVDVFLGGSLTAPTADGGFPLPTNVATELSVRRQGSEVFRSAVPPVPADSAATVRFVEASPTPSQVRSYPIGSRDDVCNRQQKSRLMNAVLGFGTIFGLGLGIWHGMKD